MMTEEIGLDTKRDDEEKELENFLFGSNVEQVSTGYDSDINFKKLEESEGDDDDVGELLSFSISTKPGKENVVAEEETPEIIQLTTKKRKIRQPVWNDDDDDAGISVNIKKVPQFRKLRKTVEETEVSGNTFQERLKTQFEKVVGAPAWADFDFVAKADSDEEEENILSTTRNFLQRSDSLPKTLLDIRKVKDLNCSHYSNAGVKCVEFHPSAKIALTAAFNKRLDLFQVDGAENSKIQSIFLEKFPIYTAHFAADGNKILLSSRRKYYYEYDLVSGDVTKIPGIKGKPEKSLEEFVLSPNGEFLAFHGSNGYTHLVSTKNHQWVSSFKINGSLQCTRFSSDSTKLYSAGGDGQVYIWDIRSRKCLHRFIDDGSLKSSSLCITKDDKYLAVGSSSGVVNIYDENRMVQAYPKPVKSIMNLTTYIRYLEFNSTGEILAIGSRAVKDALKLVHFPSMTTFSNWPTQTTPLNVVESVNFSPRSGYIAIGNARGKALLYRLGYYQDS